MAEQVKIGELNGYVWKPKESVRGVVVIFHGYGAHAKYGTIIFAAEMLAAEGFACVAGDFHGFGESPGQRGYIANSESLLDDAVAMTDYAHDIFPNLSVFVLGSSMGGNIALQVSFRRPFLKGAVLLGPMITTNASPPSWQLPILRVISYIPIIRSIGILSPPGLASDKQYRDPERRALCDNDQLGYHGPMCLATGGALLDTISSLQAKLSEVSIPFLAIHGDADEIVPLAGTKLLYEKAASTDKTLEVYPDMLHSPLCEFPDVRSKVETQILNWFKSRL
mmetsp:Transcript_21298/g.27564  ORF Transcript_21298/g.27564 Transcript_21298/m.27564 type:complete len:280 (+) Transcript_21298:43-882(+)